MKIFIFLSIFMIFYSCSSNVNKFKLTTSKSPQSISDIDPKDYYKPRGQFRVYTTGIIKINNHPVELIIYNEDEGKSLEESNLKKAVLSIIDADRQYIPALPYFHNSTRLQSNQILEIDNKFYNLSFTDKLYIKITSLKYNSSLVPDLTFQKIVPGNIHVYNLDNNIHSSFSNLIQKFKQDTILVDFWMASCPHCFENIPALQSMYSSGRYGVLSISYSYDSELDSKKMLLRYPFPGTNIKSEEPIEKYFNQNGFPYFCLVDKQTRRIIKSWIMDVNSN